LPVAVGAQMHASVASPAVNASVPSYQVEHDLLPGGASRRYEPPKAAAPSPNDLLPTVPRPMPVARPTRSAPRISGSLVGAIVAVVVLAGAGWALWPSGSGSDATGGTNSNEMQILPSNEDMAGVPSIDAAFRVQAEATARQVSSNLMFLFADSQDLSTITIDQLVAVDGSMQYVDGAINSTGTTVASLRISAGTAVFAIAGQAEICAFGRLDAQLVMSYVTAKTSNCRADSAPGTGWVVPGGAMNGGGVPPELVDPVATVDPGIVDS
jgi:hypothetical protein